MISLAWAQEAAGAAPGGDMAVVIANILPLVGIAAVIWFVVFRPQMQQAKQHTVMLKEIKKGDAVVTDGGVVGEITTIKDGFVQLKVGPATVITVAKEAVRSTLKDDVAKEVSKLVK